MAIVSLSGNSTCKVAVKSGKPTIPTVMFPELKINTAGLSLDMLKKKRLQYVWLYKMRTRLGELSSFFSDDPVNPAVEMQLQVIDALVRGLTTEIDKQEKEAMRIACIPPFTTVDK